MNIWTWYSRLGNRIALWLEGEKPRITNTMEADRRAADLLRQEVARIADAQPEKSKNPRSFMRLADDIDHNAHAKRVSQRVQRRQ
jgi:hypothetical protein